MVRQPLGAVVFAQVLAVEPVALVHDPAAGVRVHGQRAGVDRLRDAQLLGQLEDVAGAVHVDAPGHRPVPGPDLVPGGQVEDAVGALHGVAHALLHRDVALAQHDAQRRQLSGPGRVPGQRHHVVARLHELADQRTADEPCAARDEVPHAQPPARR